MIKDKNNVIILYIKKIREGKKFTYKNLNPIHQTFN